MSWPEADHGAAAQLGGGLSHAYIISGGDEEDRNGAARYLAAAALCRRADSGAPCGVCPDCRKILSGIHPDLHFYEKPADKTQLPVDAVRELRAAAYVLPNEAEKSVFIVKNAHFMNPSAQNALLKVFEEPPGHVVIALLTENAGELLPTLRSRAVTLRVRPSSAPREEPEGAERLLALMSSGQAAEAAALCLKLDKLDRSDMAELLAALRRLTAAGLKAGRGLPPERAGEFLRELEKLSRYMDLNVGAGHIAGALAAFAADPKWK